jgi:hypothetical protein
MSQLVTGAELHYRHTRIKARAGISIRLETTPSRRAVLVVLLDNGAVRHHTYLDDLERSMTVR